MTLVGVNVTLVGVNVTLVGVNVTLVGVNVSLVGVNVTLAGVNVMVSVRCALPFPTTYNKWPLVKFTARQTLSNPSDTLWFITPDVGRERLCN